jgi:hypothetical protein
MPDLYRIEIDDNPAIAKVVGMAVKEVRKENVANAKRKRAIIDLDVAKAAPATASTPAKWVLRLKRAKNDPGISGDMHVVANILHLIVYDKFEQVIDRIIRRIRVDPTP